MSPNHAQVLFMGPVHYSMSTGLVHIIVVPAAGLPAALDAVGGVRGDVRDAHVRRRGLPGPPGHTLPLHGAQGKKETIHIRRPH